MSELETVPTEILPEGTLFVSPEGVLYQVVMAGSAGFRKAEPWPWPPPSRGTKNRARAVALVPGSLLARNYPVVAQGRPLPPLIRTDILLPDGQPSHYVFPDERLAGLAAQLDEALAQKSGLAARRGRQRWLLSDGQRVFRIYHYRTGKRGEQIDLVSRLGEEHMEAWACEQGPRYWRYIPDWEKTLGEVTKTTGSHPEPKGRATPTEPTGPSVVTSASNVPSTVGATGIPQVQAATKNPKELITGALAMGEPEEQAATPAPPEPEAETVPIQDKESPAREPDTSTGRRTPAMILSIDIGYGYTKGVAPDGVNFSFPSVIGTAEEILFVTDLIRGGEERPVKYGDLRFFYGEQAVLQSRIQSAIFDRSRVHDSTYKMLFVAALVELAKLMPDAKRIKVVTGLPVDFFSDRPEVIKSFEGAYRVTAGHAMQMAVESVFVAPQPFGSLFRELLNDQGKIANGEIERGRVGVIDVGTYTTDFVVSDKLRYVQRLSGSIPIGWSKVISQVQQALADLHNLDLAPHEVDQALQAGEARVRGRPVPLEPLTKPAIADIQTAVVARARDLWGEGTSLDTILVTGGGGPQLYDVIRDVYPHARLLSNAFWANAEGLYRFGLRPATFEK